MGITTTDDTNVVLAYTCCRLFTAHVNEAVFGCVQLPTSYAHEQMRIVVSFDPPFAVHLPFPIFCCPKKCVCCSCPK